MQKIGKFEILAELGQGAMGTVYRARDPILDRPVAVKTVAPGLLAKRDTLLRFQREARAAARLQHPNIVTIFELGEMAGTLYIAMELLEGVDLAQALAPPPQLSLDQKVRIILDVCRGLDYAHKRGVVHRDVKPANIRLLKDGSVKLVDFGIAHLADSTVTRTGIVLGTPSYIAPEVLAGGRVDHRADMWAVGVVLYEMLAGRRPFDADEIPALIYRIVHEPAPPMDPVALGIPPSLVGIVAKALAKLPAERYQDLAEMAAELEPILGIRGSGEAPLPPEVRRRAYARNLEDARRFLSQNDLERALEAARRAQALEPSQSEIVGLLQDIEDRFSEAPTLVGAGPAIPTIDVAPASLARASTISGPMPVQPAPPLPTPVLTDLRVRGASVFRELGTFGEPPATQATCLSPLQDWLATSGTDGAIRIWDLRMRTRVQTLRSEMHLRTGHDAAALSLAFSPDGQLLASGHVDGAVHLWDAARGEEIPGKLRHEALVGAVAFSPDGQVLASGGMDSNLKLWDLRAALAGDARRELHRQPAGVTALCYSLDGSVLVTGHASRVLRVLDARTGRLVATLRGPDALVGLLRVSPDGRLLAVASHDRTIRVYDLPARAPLFAAAAHRKPTAALCFFPDGTHFATVALENAVHIWDVESQSPVAALWGPAEESFTGLAVFGGDHIAAAVSDGRIRLWGPLA